MDVGWKCGGILDGNVGVIKVEMWGYFC